jgi:hypothetical protein
VPDSTEAKTRRELIDPALKKACWDVGNPDQVGLEIPVDGFGAQAYRRGILLAQLSFQHHSAYIVRRFERLRAQQQEAERQAEHLFETLLERAFRGEV